MSQAAHTTKDPGEPLRIILIGAGGRKHALAWKLAQFPRVELMWVVPGNGGTYQRSRAFAKAFIKRHSIPTTAYKTFTDAEEAKTWL